MEQAIARRKLQLTPRWLSLGCRWRRHRCPAAGGPISQAAIRPPQRGFSAVGSSRQAPVIITITAQLFRLSCPRFPIEGIHLLNSRWTVPLVAKRAGIFRVRLRASECHAPELVPSDTDGLSLQACLLYGCIVQKRDCMSKPVSELYGLKLRLNVPHRFLHHRGDAEDPL